MAKKVSAKTKKPVKKAVKPSKPGKKAVARKSAKAAKKTPPKKMAVKKSAPKKPIAAKPAKKNVAQKFAAKKPARQLLKPSASKRPAGFPEQLRDAALKVLDDRQAEDIITVNLEGRSSVADYLIIASGRAARQVAAMADYLREAFMALGIQRVRVEGKSEANWVLVDAGDVVVHLFRPEVRKYYGIEEIYGVTA